MKTKILLTGLLLGLTFVCFNNTYAQNGNVIIKETAVEDFNSINCDGIQDVTIKQAEKTSVKVELDEDLQNNISFTVKNETLEINCKNIEKTTKFNIYVTCKDIKKIKTSGAASLKSDGIIKSEKLSLTSNGASDINLNIDVNSLEVNVSDAANIKLSGKAKSNEVSVGGAGNLKASDLETEKATINVSGVGKANVDVTSELRGVITGVGEIQCKNKPPIYEIIETTPDVKANKTDKNDTTSFRFGGKKMIIIDEDGNNVNKSEDMEDSKFGFKRKKNRTKIYWAGINVGINGYMNNEFGFKIDPAYRMDLNYGKSWFVDINFAEFHVPIIKHYWNLVTGMGFEFTNYKFDQKVKPIPNYQDPVYGDSYFLMQSDTASNLVRTKLSCVYFQIPLLFQFDTKKIKRNNTFHISLGVIGGVRVESHSKQVYKSNNNKLKEHDYNNFNLCPFTASATARIGYGFINIFATYQFTRMFKSSLSPDIHPFTIGITLLNF